MKITKSQLRQIIKEEINEYISQPSYSHGSVGQAKKRMDRKSQASAAGRELANGYLEAVPPLERLRGSRLRNELDDMAVSAGLEGEERIQAVRDALSILTS